MPVATDLQPLPPSRPSRYRTVRGRSAPKPRCVEPAASSQPADAAQAPDARAVPRQPSEGNSHAHSHIHGPTSGEPSAAAAAAAAAGECPPPLHASQAAAAPFSRTVASHDAPAPGDAVRQAMQQALPSSQAASPPAVPRLVPLPSARARGGHGARHDAEVADEVARQDAEADRLLADQKKKDLERLQRELDTATTAAISSKSPSRDKFAFLSRRRNSLSSAAASASQRPKDPSPPLPVASPLTATTTATATAAPAPSSATHSTSMDRTAASSAPGSAAQRRIVVRCCQSTAVVHVKPETTVADVLDAAAAQLPCALTAAHSALVESYARLGLERRLRRYERIRDIMNSWDSDSDNAFVVMPSHANGAADANANGDAVHADAGRRPPSREKRSFLSRAHNSHSGHGSHSDRGDHSAPSISSVGRHGHSSDLDLASVAHSRAAPPPGFAFVPMYHSQKPGRWSKRFITLVQETGQVVASKKTDENRLASLSGAEGGGGGGSGDFFQSICHLSDYDVYTPTEAQLRKHLRPPKAFCIALKSQQRTTVFVNTENYVHFIATDDPVQARAVYDCVFAWRSWYLVHRKLALPLRSAVKTSEEGEQSLSRQQSGRHQHAPIVAPQLASNRLPSERTERPTAESLFASVDHFGPSLQSSATRVDDQPSASAGASTFASGGLLGNAYEAHKKADAGLKAVGAACPSSSAPVSPWFPSASEHSVRQRSKSIREALAPAHPPSLAGAGDEDIPLGLQFPQLLQQRHPRSHLAGVASGANPGVAPGLGRSRSVRRTTEPPEPPPPLPSLPAPLIDLTPKFPEAPQWSKEGRGHGVRPPPGTAHLVDLATDRSVPTGRMGGGTNSLVGAAPPSATALLRRDGAPCPPSSSHGTRRAQTMTSSSATAAAGLARSRSLAAHHHSARSSGGAEVPPVPLLSHMPNHHAALQAQEPPPGSRGRSSTLSRTQ